MQQQTTLKGWQSFPMQWRLLILVCLVAGLVFRCVHLDKVYWYDETFTHLRVSGYTEAEAVRSLTDQQLVTPSAFESYRQLTPGKGVVDTVRGLAVEEPQHTPLYYILARVWAGWFGTSVSTIRLLSVVLSVLALPCMAWLGWELYQSAWAAWLGTVLLAVSPFQIIYAQEARPTALWATTILLSSAALLRALRVNTRISWVIYAIALTLNLYSYLFSLLVAIAHAVYVLLIERLRWTQVTRRFAVAFGVSVAAFSPWFVALAANSSQVDTVTNWLTNEDRFNLLALLKLWAYHLSLSFVDRGALELPLGLRFLFVLFQLSVRLAALYGLYLLYRRTSLRVWLFVVLLIAVPLLALTVPDLLFGGKRASIPRYLVPIYLGLELAMTYFLTQYLVPLAAKLRWHHRLWQVLASFVITAGIVSSAFIAQSPAWWNKGHDSRLPEIAQQINQTARPLVVSTAELGDLLSLSYYLEPKVELSVYPACFACRFNRDRIERFDLPKIPTGYSDIFLFNPRPSPAWLNQLRQQKTYQIKTLSEVKGDWETQYWLWKIENLK